MTIKRLDAVQRIERGIILHDHILLVDHDVEGGTPIGGPYNVKLKGLRVDQIHIQRPLHHSLCSQWRVPRECQAQAREDDLYYAMVPHSFWHWIIRFFPAIEGKRSGFRWTTITTRSTQPSTYAMTHGLP